MFNIETIRLGLFMALVFILMLIWQAWQQDHRKEQSQARQSAAVAEIDQIRRLAEDPSSSGESLSKASPREELTKPAESRTISVETDLLRVDIDAQGADIRRLRLKNYPLSLEEDSALYPMLSPGGDRYFVMQSGLLSSDPQVSAPNHNTPYHIEQQESAVVLQDGQDQLALVFHWQSDTLRVEKVWTFHRNSYLVDLDYRVTPVAGVWKGSMYSQLQRSKGADAERSFFQPVSYQGGAFSHAGEKYLKVGFEEMAEEPYKRRFTGGWAALLEHYFVAALIPGPQQTHQAYGKQSAPGSYTVGTVYETREVAPGHTEQFSVDLYAGPKEQARLKDAADNLVLSVDFGILTALSQPLFWVLQWIQKLVGNWGVSIILLTLLIKLAFYRLSATSYRSMAQIRKLNPKLMALRERYADDRQAMNQKMMELYREEKVNPLGGCLPILIQIPVFIALYWVLLESVELRQAPFIGWIGDLSSPDPYFVLPILMGVSMLIQQRLSPAPLDPIQQKVMMVLPVVFTVFFALFPSGLVLYWLVNNVLSIAQQWYITRTLAD